MFAYQTTGSQWLFWLYLAFLLNLGIYRCKIRVVQKTCAPHTVTISTTISSSSISSYLSSISSTPPAPQYTRSKHTSIFWITIINIIVADRRTDKYITSIWISIWKFFLLLWKKSNGSGIYKKLIHSVKLFCIKFIYLWITWKRKKTKNTVLNNVDNNYFYYKKRYTSVKERKP